MEENVDYAFNDISHVDYVKSVKDCFNLCKEKDGCTHFTYENSWKRRCHFKHSNDGKREHSSMTSGPIDCEDFGNFEKDMPPEPGMFFTLALP